MATARLYVYNETEAAINVSSTSKNMKTAPPLKFTVPPGKPYTLNVVSIDQTSSFTLSTDAAHVLTTTYDSTNGYSITPSSFDDGTVGALVAPVTVSNVPMDVLNYLVGDGQPVTYLNGLLAALVPPAVAELNKKGPYPVTIDGISLELDTLTLPANSVSCTYASRQGTGAASFNMQAIINLSAISAASKVNGTDEQISTTNLAALVTFMADANPSAPSLQVQSMQFSFLQPLKVGGFFNVAGKTVAQTLNSSPDNEKLINALNAKLKGGLGGHVSTASNASAAVEAGTPGWVGPLGMLLAQHRQP